jgi:outer membrane scaffolding protein for murein synthesis (MipA/OmpV family)
MRRVALLLVAASLAAPVHAQSTRMMMPEGTYDAFLGLTLGVTPHTNRDGSSSGNLVPALSIQWSNGIYIDAGLEEIAAGWHLSDNPVLSYGPMISVSGRDQRGDTAERRGSKSIQTGGFVNWHAAYNIEVGGELLAGGGIDGGGALAHGRIQYSMPLATHHYATLTAGMFLVDHSWMQGYFGVTPAQAIAGGNPQYRANAGVFNTYGDLEWQWQLANKYWLYSGVRLSRLGESAAHSPLAGERNRVHLRTTLSYHF